MTTNRKLVSMALVALVGAAALWRVWPERAAPGGGAGASEEAKAVVHTTAGTQTERSGFGQNAKAFRTPLISTREEAPAGARADTDPVQDRRREVEAWVASGTEAGVEKAIAAAQAEPALREAAVRALGRSGSAKAAEYVAGLLSDEDPAVVCAAIGAWTAMKGEEAIPEIAAILEKNRERTDEYREEIGKACVKALGGIGSSEALPVLEKELQWVSRQEPMLGYGENLIEAVADIGDSRGAKVLEGYADELRGKLAGDPVIRRGQILQMAEALRKAEELR
jgi:HEAT repeat protein